MYSGGVRGRNNVEISIWNVGVNSIFRWDISDQSNHMTTSPIVINDWRQNQYLSSKHYGVWNFALECLFKD